MRTQSMIAAAFSKTADWRSNPIMVAATNQRYPGVVPDTSSTTDYKGRVPFQIGSGTLMELIVAFSTMANGNNGDTPAGTDYSFTVQESYIEDDVTGGRTPVKSGGNMVFTVPMMTPKFMTDGILHSTLGYPDGAPRSSIFWYRYHLKNNVGQRIPFSTIVGQWPGASGYWYNPATGSVSAIDAAGPLTKSGTVFGNGGITADVEVFAPIILGRFKEAPEVLRVLNSPADSIGWGSNATRLNVGYRGFGPIARAMYAADGVSNPYAGIIIARSGNDSGDLSGSNTASWTYFENVTHVLPILGTNNVNPVSGSGSASTYNNLLADLRSIYAGAKARGVRQVAGYSLLPNTDSTDDWATPENQTPRPNWQIGGMTDNFRTTLANEVAINDNLDILLEFNSVRAPGERDKWGGKPGNAYHPEDGSNGGADFQGDMAEEIRAWMEAT